MTSAAMHLIGDDKGRLPEKRMERTHPRGAALRAAACGVGHCG
jgi:hypothetical protein